MARKGDITDKPAIPPGGFLGGKPAYLCADCGYIGTAENFPFYFRTGKTLTPKCLGCAPENNDVDLGDKRRERYKRAKKNPKYCANCGAKRASDNRKGKYCSPCNDMPAALRERNKLKRHMEVTA